GAGARGGGVRGGGDGRQRPRAGRRRGRGRGRGRACRGTRGGASFPVVTPRDVVTSYFAALARHDTAAAVEFLHPEVIDEITSVGVLRGPGEVRDFFDGLFRAVPDLEMKVERTVRERNTVAVQWRASGTFSGGP